MPEFKTKKKTYPILDLLKDSGLAGSKSQAKQLVLGRGVKVNGKTQPDWRKSIELKNGDVLQVGKRRFIKIKL